MKTTINFIQTKKEIGEVFSNLGKGDLFMTESGIFMKLNPTISPSAYNNDTFTFNAVQLSHENRGAGTRKEFKNTSIVRKIASADILLTPITY